VSADSLLEQVTAAAEERQLSQNSLIAYRYGDQPQRDQKASLVDRCRLSTPIWGNWRDAAPLPFLEEDFSKRDKSCCRCERYE
jgi:hypothetical protein